VGQAVSLSAPHLQCGVPSARSGLGQPPTNVCISRAFSFKLRFMRMYFLSLMLCGVGLSVVLGRPAQSPTGSDSPELKVRLVKVYDPVYPPIAHTANIYGDVELLLQIRQDGAVQSVEVVKGPPLLQKAALESARQSQFECRGCGDGVTPFKLLYSFLLSDGDCCKAADSPTIVTASEDHVWVTNSRFCTCDPAGTMERKVRSVKCLYLWRCAVR
jgi:TonB family protein